MVMIVFHHFLVHARGLRLLSEPNFSMTSHTITDGLLDSFLIMAVNCFIFITAYFGIKFRLKMVISLLVQTFTYSLLLNIVYDYFFASLSVGTISSAMFPIARSYWWFITTYLFLYMLSPLLNMARKQLTKTQFLYIASILTIVNYFIGYKWSAPFFGVNNGSSLISFITIYFYGYAFKEYFSLNWSRYIYMSIYVLSSLVIFAMFFVGLKYASPEVAYHAFAYNNPFVLISAISFFLMVKEFKFKSNFILKISPLVLGVYLIHDHRYMRILLEKLTVAIEQRGIEMYSMMFILSVLIFILAAVIEWGRAKLTEPIVQYAGDKMKSAEFDEKINMTTEAELKVKNTAI